jgi:hypothetical protein
MKLNDFYAKMALAPEDGTGATPPAAVQEPVTASTPETPAAPDFTWMGEHAPAGQPNWDSFRAHYQDLAAEAARRAEMAAGVPQDGKYDWTPPEVKIEGLPADVKIGLDTETFAPIFEELGGFLHEQGIPQSAATGLMGLMTKYEAAKMQNAMAAAKADYEKLGATPAARDARVSSVKRVLETRLPAPQAAALMKMAVSADAVRALEALAAPQTGTRAPVSTPAAIDPNLSAFDRLKLVNRANMTT